MPRARTVRESDEKGEIVPRLIGRYVAEERRKSCGAFIPDTNKCRWNRSLDVVADRNSDTRRARFTIGIH